ncbi:MAG: hypothetical protein V2I56_09440 [Desulfobacteraceae bacterium]|jgi:hypothetical protein|nr:hypothetical protein [Desulfobacteraceae bacterium]
MAARSKDTPDLFADSALDPVESATGYGQPSSQSQDTGPLSASSPGKSDNPASKKKAGFYLSVDVLQRFTLKFHELKLTGVAIDNKSTLLELALSFALDDMDKGKSSRVLQKMKG